MNSTDFMNAYQNFLDFFSMHNKERLDGLSEIYFANMTQQERMMAFSHLLAMVEVGGSEESVHGLFLADEKRAAAVVGKFLKIGVLSDEAKLLAAWNLFRIKPDSWLIPVFVQLMASADKRIRARAAHYAPSDMALPEIIFGLEEMIRIETDTLASINATNKLLDCYGITRDSVKKEKFSHFYRGLRSGDPNEQEEIFEELRRLREPAA